MKNSCGGADARGGQWSQSPAGVRPFLLEQTRRPSEMAVPVHLDFAYLTWGCGGSVPREQHGAPASLGRAMHLRQPSAPTSRTLLLHDRRPPREVRGGRAWRGRLPSPAGPGVSTHTSGTRSVGAPPTRGGGWQTRLWRAALACAGPHSGSGATHFPHPPGGGRSSSAWHAGSRAVGGGGASVHPRQGRPSGLRSCMDSSPKKEGRCAPAPMVGPLV